MSLFLPSLSSRNSNSVFCPCMISTSSGMDLFPMSLKFVDVCLSHLNMDYASANAQYASSTDNRITATVSLGHFGAPRSSYTDNVKRSQTQSKLPRLSLCISRRTSLSFVWRRSIVFIMMSSGSLIARAARPPYVLLFRFNRCV